MTCKPDPKSGFQFVKTWSVASDNSIGIKYQIQNISEKPISVGAWDVTRVPCGGIAFFPDGGQGKVPESNLKPNLKQKGITWVSIDKNPIAGNQKLFSTAKEGWLAYAISGMLFIKQFPGHQTRKLFTTTRRSWDLHQQREKLRRIGESGSLSIIKTWRNVEL